MNDIEKLLNQLSKELNLSFHSQDWGIINSSSERVEEFINYFDNKKTLHDVMKYHLYELIIASFNDAILECKVNQRLKVKFLTFLNKNSKNKKLQVVINYWKSIDYDEFPVGQLL